MATARVYNTSSFAVGTNCFSFFYIYVQANQTLFIYKSFNAGNWTSDFKWLFWCILFSAKMNQTRNKDHGFVDYIHNLMSILMMWSSETETPANQITHLMRMKNIWKIFIVFDTWSNLRLTWCMVISAEFFLHRQAKKQFYAQKLNVWL